MTEIEMLPIPENPHSDFEAELLSCVASTFGTSYAMMAADYIRPAKRVDRVYREWVRQHEVRLVCGYNPQRLLEYRPRKIDFETVQSALRDAGIAVTLHGAPVRIDVESSHRQLAGLHDVPFNKKDYSEPMKQNGRSAAYLKHNKQRTRR